MTYPIFKELRRPSVPIHVEVTELLRNRILSGALPAGAQLPPISQLSDQMGMAKMTLRHAMDTLESEGLIKRFSGRGTYVQDVTTHQPRFLKMTADLSQLLNMVEGLEAKIVSRPEHGAKQRTADSQMVNLSRIHMLQGKPFCLVDLELIHDIYDMAPARFETEVAVTVLEDLGIDIASAKQRVTISYADIEAAQTLGVRLNSPVMKVARQFRDSKGKRIYSANLIYPGESLGFEIDFSVSD